MRREVILADLLYLREQCAALEKALNEQDLDELDIELILIEDIISHINAYIEEDI